MNTAWEKMNEDESDESKADAKSEAKSESKHAQKRAAKKDDNKPSQQQREEDAAMAKKLLKVLDSEKLAGSSNSQFKNLFLCVQVVMAFCYGRVKSSILSVYGDMNTAC